METAKYRLVVYIRVAPEEAEPLTHAKALSEKEHQEFLFPENIYRIEEIEPVSTGRKEAPCIPPDSKKN